MLEGKRMMVCDLHDPGALAAAGVPMAEVGLYARRVFGRVAVGTSWEGEVEPIREHGPGGEGAVGPEDRRARRPHEDREEGSG